MNKEILGVNCTLILQLLEAEIKYEKIKLI